MGTLIGYSWVNDMNDHKRILNVVEHRDEKETQIQTFIFITDFKLTKKGAQKLVDAGRSW